IVTSWNPAAERLYGFTADEIVGQSILRIVPPSLHAEEDYILGKIRAGERIDHFETLRMRKDGSTVEVSITISPVRDSHGRLIGASKIARDISHQREEQRKKDQFLAILAHELRNPLAAIRYSLAYSRQAGVGEAAPTRSPSASSSTWRTSSTTCSTSRASRPGASSSSRARLRSVRSYRTRSTRRARSTPSAGTSCAWRCPGRRSGWTRIRRASRKCSR